MMSDELLYNSKFVVRLLFATLVNFSRMLISLFVFIRINCLFQLRAHLGCAQRFYFAFHFIVSLIPAYPVIPTTGPQAMEASKCV